MRLYIIDSADMLTTFERRIYSGTFSSCKTCLTRKNEDFELRQATELQYYFILSDIVLNVHILYSNINL